MNYTDTDYALYPREGGGMGIGLDEGVDDTNLSYKTVSGWVSFPQGIARVSSHHFHRLEPDGINNQGSWIEVIKAGRSHIRRFDKFYRPRYLVTLAKRFAKELFE